MRIGLIYIWILLVTGSCLDPLDIGIDDVEPTLVVEGLIADQPGASFVRLGTTSDIQGVGENLLGTGAQIRVTDNGGLEHPFQEIFPGTYIPLSSFLGEVGRSYTLNVVTSDGQQYVSTSQELTPPIDIDRMFLEFEEFVNPDTGEKTGAHRVLLDISNNLSQTFYFRTFSRGIAHVFSQPAAECGGCEECWDFRIPINNQIFTGSNLGFTSDFTFESARIGYDFRDEYFVETTLFSLTPEGHEFWQSIERQLEITGTIFDPQITAADGNITNLDPNGPIANGYFGASAITQSNLIFNRAATETDITFQLMPGVCVEVWPNATNNKPEEFN